MNILFIHEVDWINKVVFDIHSLAEALSLLGHRVFAIDYENSAFTEGHTEYLESYYSFLKELEGNGKEKNNPKD